MIRLRPGPPATVEDLRRAQELTRLLADELARVRAAASAWRTGLGGLLVALVGFSLVRGRTDVAALAPNWSILVGVLLLAALAVGAAGALALLRAAHGRLSVTPVTELAPAPVGDHLEAVAAARALRVGVRLVLACTALLVAAVGITWYGPERTAPVVRVSDGAQAVCGTVTGASGGALTVATTAGPVRVPLTETTTITAAAAC